MGGLERFRRPERCRCVGPLQRETSSRKDGEIRQKKSWPRPAEKLSEVNILPLNAYSRKCLGQGYALLHMKMTLYELVRRVRWRVDLNYQLKLTSVSSDSYLIV